MGEDYLNRHLTEVPAFRALLRAAEARLFAQLGELPRPLLALGCGDGHFDSVVFAAPLEVGIDTAAASLLEAQRRGTYKQVIMASATTMPFRDGAFATVASNSVIEHIPEVEMALGEVARTLRPGGQFIFSVPSEHFAEYLFGSTILSQLGLPGWSKRYGQWHRRIARAIHCLPPERWAEMLARVGLSVTHWRYYFSRPAMNLFDILHYLSSPALLNKQLFGRWVLWPWLATHSPLVPWMRRYYEEDISDTGAYLFFVAEKGR